MHNVWQDMFKAQMFGNHIIAGHQLWYNKTALYATKFEENDKNVVYILKHNIKKGSR